MVEPEHNFTMVLKNCESTKPAFECNFMVKRGIGCVDQNRKTGSSCEAWQAQKFP